MRFWGEAGEVLEARIDLNKSYDLQNKALDFKCQALYPNQKNVAVQEESRGVFLIRVTHDPGLPKGRIPVICTASNRGAVPSNPVFINFYWPGEDEADDYVAMGELPNDVRAKVNALGLKRLPVTVNKRPMIDVGFTGDAVRCAPGQTVSIDLKATDPEGFPVAIFRRPGEIGTVEQGRFTATIPQTDQEKIYLTHFIFSDGTGGYAGKKIKLLVAKQEDILPKDWAVTTLGTVQRAVRVSFAGDTFSFGNQPVERQAEQMQGTFVFQPVSRAADLICRIPQIKSGHDMTLIMTNTLDGFSRKAGLGLFQGKISGVIRPGEQSWNELKYQHEEKRSNDPVYFRLIWRDGTVATYTSRDARAWMQVQTGQVAFYAQCYAGLLYRGNPWTSGECQWLSASSEPLPILTTGKHTPDKQGLYSTPLEISLISPGPGMTMHYTLDGSEPTAQSQVYQNPIRLTQAGQHEIRVKAVREGVPSHDTAVAVYTSKP
jgi:hypothetical protein